MSRRQVGSLNVPLTEPHQSISPEPQVRQAGINVHISLSLPTNETPSRPPSPFPRFRAMQSTNVLSLFLVSCLIVSFSCFGVSFAKPFNSCGRVVKPRRVLLAQNTTPNLAKVDSCRGCYAQGLAFRAVYRLANTQCHWL